MRLTKEHQICAASADPIRKTLERMVEEMNRRRRYLGGKVTNQAIVNAALAKLAGMPTEEWAGFLDEGLDTMEGVEMDTIAWPDLE